MRQTVQHNRVKNAFLPLQVLNLFLALLLSSFGASNLSAAGAVDEDTNKLAEAFNRIGRFRRWLKRIVIRALCYFRDKIISCFRNQLSSRRGKQLTPLIRRVS